MRFTLSVASVFAALVVANACEDESGNNGNHGNGQQGHPAKVVKGKVFDRIVTIWFENTDFSSSFADPNFRALAAQGISLTNYYGLTHPSEPNAIAHVGGEYFGMNDDNLYNLPQNVSSVVDLLEDKGITWGEYQEDMPYTGFLGMNYSKTSASDYVRKVNPLVIYESVTTNPKRLANLKNFTLFEQELAANTLPQWIYMTPNMTNDGHDTSVTFAGTYARNFLEPLLKNPHFNTPKTLIVLSWDENASESAPNHVYSMLLGNAIPKSWIGKTDASFYNHYSMLATVEANFNLHTLGRYDVGANVVQFVGEQTGDKIRAPANASAIQLNLSYPGMFNNANVTHQAIPNTKLTVNGRTVLPAIQKAWAAQQKCTPYKGDLVPNDGHNPPQIPQGC